jgi:hypothetical protein
VTREEIRKRGSVGSVGSAELLPLLRDLYSKHPEMLTLEPWHLAWVLFALGYTDELEDEGAIAAAAEVARTDWIGEVA